MRRCSSGGLGTIMEEYGTLVLFIHVCIGGAQKPMRRVLRRYITMAEARELIAEFKRDNPSLKWNAWFERPADFVDESES